MHKLCKLDDPVVEELRSNFNIYNQGQAIEELVLNSVDANATVIEVFADTQNFAFEVRDNGDGMAVEDLELIGQRHGKNIIYEILYLSIILININKYYIWYTYYFGKLNNTPHVPPISFANFSLATSKLKSLYDQITSNGFRGEAVASVRIPPPFIGFSLIISLTGRHYCFFRNNYTY
jgi:hypothetical protein